MVDQPKVPPSGGSGETPARPAEGTTAAPLPKAGAAPTKPVASKPVLAPEPWSSPLLDELQKRFPGALSNATVFRNLPAITVAKEALLGVCELLRSEEGGGYALLTDETAVDYPNREKRFEVIYHLYSFTRNDRLRLKVRVGEEEKVPSVVGIWPTANWLEREVYDMFGVQYEGHPDLKRILLPDGWTGHPLRKDHDILKQDVAWVQANLGIKSGQ